MKRVLIVAVALACLAALGGFMFAWTGLYNVGASAGHWPATTWFLHFGLRQSVEHHAAELDPPALDDATLIHVGLGHYEGACQPCHGAPGRPRNPVVRQMLPEPPYLPDRVADWTPSQLFWIVRHGLKYTGMPSWPAPKREDEVWAVVAALLRLPRMTGAEYDRLRRSAAPPRRARGGAALTVMSGQAGEALAACARCHGAEGGGGGAGGFPRLGGQSEEYLAASMEAYALGTRPSGLMQPVAAALNPEERAALAAYFARVRPSGAGGGGGGGGGDPRGREIAEKGVPDRGIPACATCHGPRARAENPLLPRLDGQFAPYLANQMRLFRRGVRGGGPLSKVMNITAHSLEDDEIAALAAHYAALPWGMR